MHIHERALYHFQSVRFTDKTDILQFRQNIAGFFPDSIRESPQYDLRLIALGRLAGMYSQCTQNPIMMHLY